jgi:hypothetical protein
MKASIPSADYDRSKLAGDNGILQLGNTITNDVRCTRNLKCRIGMAKSAINKKKNSYQRIGLICRE